MNTMRYSFAPEPGLKRLDSNDDGRFAGDEKMAPVSWSETQSTLDDGEEKAMGSTSMYDQNGNLRMIPMPTPDPKDPLNLTERTKWIAIAAISFFGSLALSAEVIIGSLIPVFLLEYSGVDPHLLNNFDFVANSHGNANFNPISVVPAGVVPADLGKVSMLATVPLLTNGLASYLLVPLSIAIGRRPVLLLTGMLAWIGGLWAGFSTSLNQHLMARALQGLGAGAVEALIPLIVQDMMFIHKRNKAMSAVVSSQGIIIIGLGILAPYLAVTQTWRWLYYITSGTGFVAWLLLIAFLPETRWMRSNEELSGQKVYPLEPGETRPRLDPNLYGPRTIWTTIGMFQFGFEWKAAFISIFDSIRTTFLPAMVWATLANSAFNIINQAAQQLGSFALLAQGWQFKYTGLAVIPFVVASAGVFLLGGPLSDKMSMRITKYYGGVREPEYNLPNLGMPFLSGIIGCFLFGWAVQNGIHWVAILIGSFFILFGFLTVVTVLNVFAVESYPAWAGPVLVNVSSLRLIISFFISSDIQTWVATMGIFQTFALYGEALLVLSLGIPILYFSGKRLRMWTGAKVKKAKKPKRVDSA